MGNDPSKFFISYNMVEGQLIANMLYLAFSAQGSSIFLAEKRGMNLPWKKYLFGALKEVGTVIVICTNRYYNTKYTKIEYDEFLKKKKTVIILEDTENAGRLPGKEDQVSRIKLHQTWKEIAYVLLEAESCRCNCFKNGYDNMLKMAIDSQADRLGVVPALPSFFSSSALKEKLNNAMPIMLIDKDDIDSKIVPIDYKTLLPLKSVVFVVEHAWNSMVLYKPKKKEFKECSYFSMKKAFFEYFITQHQLMKEEDVDQVTFEGPVADMLEKFLGTDDVQIFFLPFDVENSFVPTSDQNYMKDVLSVMLQVYNKD